MQRGKTPWVPSQPTAIRPKVCEGVRTWSGSAAQRLANAVRLSSATGRVARSRLPSQSIARCHRAGCLLTSLVAPSRFSVRTRRSAGAPRLAPLWPAATSASAAQDLRNPLGGRILPSIFFVAHRGSSKSTSDRLAGPQAPDASGGADSDSAGAGARERGMVDERWNAGGPGRVSVPIAPPQGNRYRPDLVGGSEVR